MLTQTRTMKAAILVELGKPLVVDQVTLPEKLDVGQVLVKVFRSGICGSQIGEIAGVKGPDKYLPHLLGHEGGAEVLEIGPGVRHVKVGQRVVMHWRKGNGIDAVTPTYQWQGKKLNAGSVTTFNEYAIVSENRLTPVPQSFDMELAALFGCPVTTGLGVVTNNAKLTIGESIVVLGAGGVGLSVIQGAGLVSAYPIVAVDLQDEKLELARKLGATHTINSSGITDLADRIKAIVGPQGADAVIENTGNTGLIRVAYDLTHPQGRTILVGVPKAGQDASLHTLPLHFGKVLTGSQGGETQPQTDIPRYVRLHEAGKLALSSLITRRFSLDQINEALDAMRQGTVAGRCIVEIHPVPPTL
jgi:S-(hydroxymethyl)glutathione dehydrogenase / alcohol dehydrogenase